MTTSHHYPAAPGSTRSIVAPHMHVLGNERDMLGEDVALAETLMRAAEATADEAITTWLRCRTEARAGHRRIARLAVVRLRMRRGACVEALRRLGAARVGRVAA